MNVLIIGGGGREHALGARAAASPGCGKLFFLPGNAGTAAIGTNLTISPTDAAAIATVCNVQAITLVIVGPEQPIAAGLTDTLREKGLTVFGPSAAAGRIESDKAYAKALMQRAGVPTAAFAVFTAGQAAEARKHAAGGKLPVVIKASGLAAGKGVYICETPESAAAALSEIFEQRVFGSSGDEVVIEEFMEGEEASLFIITDGERFTCLPAAQDHKRIGEGDTGKNTGGMGAYAPAPVYTAAVHSRTVQEIIEPVLRTMKAEGTPFTGCLYCGLMLTAEGPKVVEFNCRFGDPETQAVVQVTGGDFLGLLYSAATGTLRTDAVEWNGGAAACVIAASGGYPGAYRTGDLVTGLTEAGSIATVFHSGTALLGSDVVTAGGRVLGVTAFSPAGDIREAAAAAYAALGKISFNGMYYRRDIAHRALAGQGVRAALP